MQRNLALPRLGIVVGFMVLTTLGCSTDRVVDGESERFACFNNSDCVKNYSCFCGFCQPLGGPQRCMGDGGGATDAGTSDAGTTDVGPTDTGTTDTGPTDTGTTDAGSAGTPANCDPVDWSGCPSGQACYWNDGIGKTVCQPYGSLGQNDACDPAVVNSCGKSKSGAPLLCDGPDKKCYPLCRAGSSTCAAGETCYPLEDADKKPWPKQTGICAK